MLEHHVHLSFLLVGGALHRGHHLLLGVHIDDDAVLGQLLLHQDHFFSALQCTTS